MREGEGLGGMLGGGHGGKGRGWVGEQCNDVIQFWSPSQDPETASLIRRLETKKLAAVKGDYLGVGLKP